MNKGYPEEEKIHTQEFAPSTQKSIKRRDVAIFVQRSFAYFRFVSSGKPESDDK